MLLQRMAFAALCTLALAFTPCAAAEPDVFADGARVVFLGDSITYAGGYIDTIETWLLTQFPDRRVEIINLGLSSETVSGLTEPDHPFPRPDVHERLDRALARTQPDVVVACYGMNDGIYHPYGDERAQAYHDGIDGLIAKVDAAGAKLILMTPPPFEPSSAGDSLVDATAPEFGYKTPYRDYNDVIARYGRWLLDERSDAVTALVDLHGPLTEHLATARRTDPDFRLTGDSVHPNPTGHWLIARYVVASLGEEAGVDRAHIDFTSGMQIKGTVRGDLDLARLDNKQLTLEWTCRVPGPRLPGAELSKLSDGDLLTSDDRHILQVLIAGKDRYQVFEGNQLLAAFAAEELRLGIDVRQLTGASINKTASELAKLVTARQRLMRNAWLTHVGHLRPGIPKGLPLDEARAEAAKLTAQIDELRQPQTLGLRIVSVDSAP